MDQAEVQAEMPEVLALAGAGQGFETFETSAAARSRPGLSYPRAAAAYCRAMTMRISLSVSVMRSPDRSTVTVCSVPVKGNGAW